MRFNWAFRSAGVQSAVLDSHHQRGSARPRGCAAGRPFFIDALHEKPPLFGMSEMPDGPAPAGTMLLCPPSQTRRSSLPPAPLTPNAKPCCCRMAFCDGQAPALCRCGRNPAAHGSTGQKGGADPPADAGAVILDLDAAAALLRNGPQHPRRHCRCDGRCPRLCSTRSIMAGSALTGAGLIGLQVQGASGFVAQGIVAAGNLKAKARSCQNRQGSASRHRSAPCSLHDAVDERGQAVGLSTMMLHCSLRLASSSPVRSRTVSA